MFIAFEGSDSAGKTTQSKLLAKHLECVWTREPGDTKTGQKIRDIVLGNNTIEPLTEAFLMFADRAQHVSEVIRPTLASGKDVVCDRYTGSTVAYQGYGRGIDVQALTEISKVATGNLVPDLTIMLRVTDTETEARMNLSGKERDRIEQTGEEFRIRVQNGFDVQAELYGWVVIDGTGTVNEVHERVLEAVRAFRATGSSVC